MKFMVFGDPSLRLPGNHIGPAVIDALWIEPVEK